MWVRGLLLLLAYESGLRGRSELAELWQVELPLFYFLYL